MPWLAEFTKNAQMQTTRVLLTPEDGHGLQPWEIVPERRGNLLSVRIAPLMAQQEMA